MLGFPHQGRMAERSKAPVSKTGRGESSSRVRIPLLPQLIYLVLYFGVLGISGGGDSKAGARRREAGSCDFSAEKYV